MEIMPGLHWVERIWDTKVYVLVENGRLVVVDAAMPGRAAAIWRHLESMGYPPEAVDQIWLTHGDIDHMGSAAALKACAGAKVVAHRADAPLVEGRADRELGSVPLNGTCRRLFNWAIRRVLRYQPTSVDWPVQDGDDLGGWQAVHVPGHTPGSLCFYNPAQKIVITGDALNHQPRRRQPLGAPQASFTLDMAQAHASIRKIAALNFEVCCFGHGPPLMENARQRVQMLADSLGV
jgi:glyoxylase-like metal-dependent hydrolase (beta-lactamase superfamily II)